MNEKILRHDRHCRLCGGSKIATIMHLNDTPLEDQFVSPRHKYYPTSLSS